MTAGKRLSLIIFLMTSHLAGNAQNAADAHCRAVPPSCMEAAEKHGAASDEGAGTRRKAGEEPVPPLSHEPPAPGRSQMLVRISEIEIYPEYRDEYLSEALKVGAVSVRKEAGVIAIFPMVRQKDSCQVRILEIYADGDAYKRHTETEHFKAYKQGTLHMVKSLDLVDMKPMNPAAMPEIFLKMGGGK